MVELLFATGCLRNVEAVLQHLEARHDIARNRQDDRELRRGDLAGRLDPGLERSEVTEGSNPVSATRMVLQGLFSRI